MTAHYLDDGDVRIWHGDALEALRHLPYGSAQTCITSPPFWGLRDYGTGTWTGGRDDCDHAAGAAVSGSSTLAGNGHQGGGPQIRERTMPYRDDCGKCGATRPDQQIGLEQTPDEWVDRLVHVFREVRRVLRDDGTLWLEVGDSYAGSWGNQGRKPERGEQRPINGGMLTPVLDGRYPDKGSNTGAIPPGVDFKPKDLVGAPWLLAFALRADGWYLRSDIIWSRPNPMPESVTDRPTKAHSYIFLLTKRSRYYYDADAIREAWTDERNGASGSTASKYAHAGARGYPGGDGGVTKPPTTAGRNARSVWSISTEPTPFAHFATFPQALVERCIKAGTSERGACPNCGAPWARQVESGESSWEARKAAGHSSNRGGSVKLQRGHGATHDFDNSDGGFGTPAARTTTGWAPTCTCPTHTPVPQLVLDPFMGSGTTALVARRLGRHAVGTDLSEEYLGIARKRLAQLSLLGGIA